MKHYIIGDVHGAGLELEQLINQNRLYDGQIIIVGDCFDRGLHAPLVWDLIQDLKIKVFMGNHEYKTLNWLKGNRPGGVPKAYIVALNALLGHGVTPNQLLDWHRGLPQLEDFGSFIVTHAGVVIDAPNELNVDMNVFYSPNRNHYLSDLKTSQVDVNIPKLPIPTANDGNIYWWDLYDGDKMVVYGHLVTGDNLPRIRKNKSGRILSVGIDTAVCHGGPLTCYCPEDNRFFQYQSGVDWAEQCRVQMKSVAPIVNAELMAFVNEQQDRNRIEVAV